MPRKTVWIIFFLSFAGFAGATEIQTEEETLQGTILGKQGDEIFFETRNGILNIRKADILSVDGKPYTYAAPKPAVPPAPAPAPDSEELITGGAEEPPSYLGYVPLSERRTDSEVGKQGANVGIQFGTAVEPAQDSLGSKASIQEGNRDTMLVHPTGVTEKELKEYYSAHREEFREPLRVHVRSLGQAFFTRSESEIRSDPSSEGGWRDGGWIEAGKTVEPFEESVLRQIFDLNVGGVSRLMRDKDGVGYLLRVVERKESAIPSYEEIRPKVLNKILLSRK